MSRLSPSGATVSILVYREDTEAAAKMAEAAEKRAAQVLSGVLNADLAGGMTALLSAAIRPSCDCTQGQGGADEYPR